MDGHPNPEGHEFIADRLVEFTHGRPELRRVFQERGTAPASLPAASSDTPRPLKIATWNIRWLTPRDSRSGSAEADYAALRRHAKPAQKFGHIQRNIIRPPKQIQKSWFDVSHVSRRW